MALTFKEGGDARQNLGFSCIAAFNTIQPAASDYPTGGYPMYSTAGNASNAGQPFGLGFLHGMIPVGYTGTAFGYEWKYNKTTAKLQVFYAPTTGPGALVEVPNGTDLSGGTVILWVFGF